MDVITIDGVDENDFRRSIEEMLRHGEVDDAAVKLRGLLEPYSGEHRILPGRFLTVSSDEIALAGLEGLAERLRAHDRPEHPISAIGVTVTGPEAVGGSLDEPGGLTPCIETSYYSDAAFPFSMADRNDLLEGYSQYGCEWQGDFEEADSALSVEGVDDLFAAVTRLEARLLDSEQPSSDEIRAGSLGACYLAVLIHQAVRDSIRRQGLPRPLCVMAGNSGVYPFFDAPVMSSEECADGGTIKSVSRPPESVPAEAVEAAAKEASQGSSDYDSLLSLGLKKGNKKPVIVLDPAEAEAAARADDLVAAQHMAEAGKSVRAVLPISLEELDRAARAAGAGEPGEAGGADGLEDLDRMTELARARPDDTPPLTEQIDDADQPAAASEQPPFDDAVVFHRADAWDGPAEDEAADPEPVHAYPIDLPDIDAPMEQASGDHRDEPAEPELARDAPAPPKAAKADDRPGHSLRAQIARTSVPRTTFADRVLALLRRLLGR